MSLKPYILTEALPPVALAPLVVDSPHSGRIYPADFDYACPLPMLRQTEDSYVDELVMGAPQSGAALLTAEFPRSYIDVNRAEDDIDPALLAAEWPSPLAPSERTLQGLGLVRRLCRSGVTVYRTPVPVEDVQYRIERFYRPYHSALDQALQKRKALFGECYLIDAHSMPGQSPDRFASRRPDFVLGDRNGTSCDPSFTRRVGDILQEMGYSIALNDPYKGMEIVRRYGQPQQGLYALQLEINRQLYMNEQTLQKHDGFKRLQKDLTGFFRQLVDELSSQIPDRLAAE